MFDGFRELCIQSFSRIAAGHFGQEAFTVADHPIPRIQADDYPTFRKLIRSLPATFSQWTTFIEADVSILSELGRAVIRTDIEPEGFSRYLKARLMGPTLPQLYKYAAYRILISK